MEVSEDGSSFLSISAAGDSSVADNPTSKNGDDATTSQLPKSKSVGFVPTGKVRWFMKNESITSAIFQDEEYLVDFSEERRKVVRKQVVVKSERVPSSSSVPFSMSLLDNNGVFSKRERSSSHEYTMKPVLSHHTTTSNNKQIQVVLLHSQQYTQILYQSMKHIHQDRDLLLEALLKWCGFFHGARTIINDGSGGESGSKRRGALAAFLTIVPPQIGTRALLELFHDGNYLDLLEFPSTLDGSRKGEASATDGAKETNDQHTALNADIASFSLVDNEARHDFSSTSTNQHKLRKRDFSNDSSFQKLLAEHGLEDDCPLPTDDYSKALLWKYCLSVAGASWHAASLLVEHDNDHHADVVVNWGGGRHHAHASKAGGFCYVNDIVLAIKRLLQSQSVHEADVIAVPPPRVLYIDIDIHHCDGVQQAFYSTDLVMTASFHRNAPGFFPATSGFVREKGEVDTPGLGYNLNVPLPTGIDDITFIRMFRKMVFGLVNSFDPEFIVLCVGADGLEGDALVTGKLHGTDHDASTGEGWSLSPEGLAECVRITSSLCAGLKEEMICTRPTKEVKKENQPDENTSDGSTHLETKAANDARESVKLGKRRKLLVLGGGGYTPSETARTNLLCTAAACEGARSGLLWSELPKDIPSHDYFPRYGPLFELVSEEKKQAIWNSYDIQPSATNDSNTATEESTPPPFFDEQNLQLQQGIHAIELACLFIDRQRKKALQSSTAFNSYKEPCDRDDDDIWVEDTHRKKKASQGGRRRKKKKEV